MLENMVHIAEETGADIVKGNYNNFVGMGEERRDFYSTVSPYPDDYEKLTDPKMDNHCFTWGMSEWLGIYRMDFLREYNIRHNETKGAAFQDTGFWFLSFAYANKIYLTNRYYYNYRRDNPYSSMRSSGNVYGICIEYDYIKGCIGEDEDTMKRVYSAWYRGFFYDNCVACNRLNDTNRHELIGRMRKTRLEGDAEGKIDRRLYSADEWDDLQLLLKSGDEFLKKKYPDKNIQEENRKILINVIKAHEETVIFGAGWYGCNLQFLLENLNIKIAAFADNDAKKWGSRRNSLEILSLEECERRFRDAIYLIANKDHSSDIYNGLLEKGISTERIKICRLETLTDSIV